MTDLTYGDCPTCFVAFAYPATMDKARRQDGKPFYCPNGHSIVYTDSENDRIRRERDRLKQQTAELEDRVRDWMNEATLQSNLRTEAERSIAAMKGVVTKMKKRTANGVCPCCTRSFTDLRRHMASKHPGFSDDNVVVPFKAESVA